MVQREMDGPGQQSWEAPPAEGNLRKAQSGMTLTSCRRGSASSFLCVRKRSFSVHLWQTSVPEHLLEFPFLVFTLQCGWPAVSRGFRALHWPLPYREHCTGIPRYRNVFKPMLRNWGNNCNVMASFCRQGRAEICPDTFHCRCTRLRCRSSRPKRTMQETTDARSPIRISLTAVPSILKYMVRETSSLDKFNCFLFMRYERIEENKAIY